MGVSDSSRSILSAFGKGGGNRRVGGKGERGIPAIGPGEDVGEAPRSDLVFGLLAGGGGGHY